MKKNMYWIIALLLLLAVILFALFGRGVPESGGDIGAETTTATETTAPTEMTLPGDATTPTAGEDSEAEFVPSVTYKGGPFVIKAVMNDREMTSCIVVTTVEEAQEKKTDITQEERDLLVDVYKQLANGTMALPIEGEYVIRDFVDISFRYEACREVEDHGEKDEELDVKGTTLIVEFDLEISTSTKLMVMAYIDGEWVEVPCVNNGDGTVTCEFENVCPVAFIVLK